jgi:predicted nuclease of predicted toxin-antitoxin system
MLRLLIDENFDQRILRGLQLRLQRIDYLMVLQVGLGGSTDEELLEWAAKKERIIMSHDANTMPRHASRRLKLGIPMAGLVIVPQNMEIGLAIDDLSVIIECATESGLRDQILYLPL